MIKIQHPLTSIVFVYMLFFATVQFSSCSGTSSNESMEKWAEELKNKQYVDQIIEELENPPPATSKEDIEIELKQEVSIKEILTADIWKDNGTVGGNILFTDTSFYYLIEGYDPAAQPWKLVQDCKGVANPDGPYIMRGTGEFAECYLIVKLNDNELIIEYQGANIQMKFRR